jgi:hypothetical protein
LRRVDFGGMCRLQHAFGVNSGLRRYGRCQAEGVAQVTSEQGVGGGVQ